MSDSPELTDMKESDQGLQWIYSDPFALFLPAFCPDSTLAASHAAGGDWLTTVRLSFNESGCCCLLRSRKLYLFLFAARYHCCGQWCGIISLFSAVTFICMLRMAQHVDLTLTSPPPFSPLPIYPNLLLANNFAGILNTSGFSLLVPTTLSPSFPHLL